MKLKLESYQGTPNLQGVRSCCKWTWNSKTQTSLYQNTDFIQSPPTLWILNSSEEQMISKRYDSYWKSVSHSSNPPLVEVLKIIWNWILSNKKIN